MNNVRILMFGQVSVPAQNAIAQATGNITPLTPQDIARFALRTGEALSWARRGRNFLVFNRTAGGPRRVELIRALNVLLQDLGNFQANLNTIATSGRQQIEVALAQVIVNRATVAGELAERLRQAFVSRGI